MSKNFTLLLFSTALLCTHLRAQNWVNGGNTLSANGTLGTNSSHSLIFETAGADRGRIANTGLWGIGGNVTDARLTVTGAAGARAFRVRVGADTKFVVQANGGVSVGSLTAGPANGLYVVGNVGIGTSAPAYPLDVLNPSTPRGINVNNNFTGNEDRVGVYAKSVNNPGWGYGVQGTGGYIGVYGIGKDNTTSLGIFGLYGEASGSGGSRYGVYGKASGGTNVYGVYGNALTGTTFTAAGYFNGAVYATTYQLISDRKFKSDIIPLDHPLQQIMKLKPSAYSFKATEYKSMHLPEGKQIGLIADEVKEVFPELVSQAVHPAQYDENKKEISPEIKYEAVNYQGLIPVLVASVQELNQKTEKIEELQARIAKLEEVINKLTNAQSTSTSGSSSALLQNTPNPVRGTTRITYSLPDGVTRAQLQITDALGRTIKTIQLTASGVVNFDASFLSIGVYNYSLIVNDKIVDTRKMTVER